MTSLQLGVLARAHCDHGSGVMQGTSLNFEYQAGRIRQVKWLIKHKLARMRLGRLVATRSGRKIYAYHMS